MEEQVLAAIEAGDVARLDALLEGDPALAHAPLPCGAAQARLPPLHLVCDAAFRGLVTEPQALALADRLLAAGVDPDLAFAPSGDTFLISAASLGAEEVGLRLVERGADVGARGLFGATALHWCAFVGLPRLAEALLEAGAPRDLRDSQHDCTPLEWAQHAWTEDTNGRREELPEVARVLVRHGAAAGPAFEDLLQA